MEDLQPFEISFEYEGNRTEYDILELFEKLEGNYQNNSEYPIGLMFPYEGGVVDPSLNKLNRARVVAEDYSDIFKLSFLPDFFESKFKPFADLIHPDISLNEMYDLLEENVEQTENDHYVMRLNLRTELIDRSLRNLIDADERIISVNPVEMKKILNDKKKHLEYLDERGFPIIPYMDAVEAVERGKSYVEKEVGNTGEGWVVKFAEGYGGHHVKHRESLDGVREILEDNIDELNNGGELILQPKIEHEYDYRLILVGDKTVSAERRKGLKNDFRTNISQIPGSIGEKLLRGVITEAFEPVEVDSRRLMSDKELEEDENALIREIQDLGEEIIEGFEDFKHPDASIPNFFVAADIMVPDDKAIEGLPREYQDRMREWSNSEGNAAILELNDGSGDIISHNADAYKPPDIPVLHEIGMLKELAGIRPVPPENIPRNYSTREWRRAAMIYRGMSPSEIIARENLQKNIREGITEMLGDKGVTRRETERMLEDNFGFNFDRTG